MIAKYYAQRVFQDINKYVYHIYLFYLFKIILMIINIYNLDYKLIIDIYLNNKFLNF